MIIKPNIKPIVDVIIIETNRRFILFYDGNFTFNIFILFIFLTRLFNINLVTHFITLKILTYYMYILFILIIHFNQFHTL